MVRSIHIYAAYLGYRPVLPLHADAGMPIRMFGRRLPAGNLDPEATSTELDEIFRRYGKLSNIWVARNPPGFAFVVSCLAGRGWMH